MPVPHDVSGLHGLTTELLAGAPPAGVVVREFLAWLPRNARLVAHNARYDQDILGWEMDRAGVPWPSHRVVDSCRLAAALGETSDNRLRTLVAHHGWRSPAEGHRALPDAEMVRLLVLHARRRGLQRRCSELFEGRLFGSRARCPRRLPRKLARFSAAIAQGSRLEMRYTDRQAIRTHREVTPFGFAEVAGVLLLHGWCHLREARRTFLGSRAEIMGPAAI
jgi:DNA polymerase III epsilon subunit-like protein